MDAYDMIPVRPVDVVLTLNITDTTLKRFTVQITICTSVLTSRSCSKFNENAVPWAEVRPAQKEFAEVQQPTPTFTDG